MNFSKEDDDSMDSCLNSFLDSHEDSFNSGEGSSSKNDSGVEICENPSPHHLKILKKYFGHSDFRPMQWKIISSILKDKKDNFAVMSTGYGKSLCYQYPAVYSGGVTLVISPLISLMEDQVLSLNTANIPACFLGSAQKQKSKVMDKILNKEYSIVYLTPELMVGDYGQGVIESMRDKLDICVVAIDEAHCISSWGHDFRHQYRKLGRIREILPGVPILAVTATATEKVEKDILKSLRLRNPQVLHSGFDRPNLFLEVFQKSKQSMAYDFSKVLENVCGKWKFPGPTIVYCLTRKSTDTVTEYLKSRGLNCAGYHAGKGVTERKEIHEKFLKDQIDVIVATSAFGMGIDKPDVRCVVHHGTPSSVEAYYQEIGRAGRDGEPARCVIFFNMSDFQTHQMIDQKSTIPKHGKDNKEDMSNNMRKFLYSTECRRGYILSYFGEKYDGDNKNCCDNCFMKNSAFDQKYEGIDENGFYDFTVDVVKMLKTIEALKGSYGLTTYIAFLRGSKAAKMKEEHKRHEYHGCGKDKSENWWKSIGNLLIQEQMINKKPVSVKGFNIYVFALSDKGSKFLEESVSNNKKLLLKPSTDIIQQLKPKKEMLVPSYNSDGNVKINSKSTLVKNMSLQNGQDEMDKKLYTSILGRRNQIADERDCMPHNVISIHDIKELVRVKPRSLKELDKCKLEMFSEFKIHQFGQELIDIIIKELGPSVDREDSSKKSIVEALLEYPLSSKSSESAEISYNFFKQGMTIQEVSEHRGLSPTTVFSHLIECMKKGMPIKLKQMGVDEKALIVIFRAILKSPEGLLSPIKEKCPPEITWDQIKTVLMYVNVRNHLEKYNIEYEDFEEFSFESMKGKALSSGLNTVTAGESAQKISTSKSPLMIKGGESSKVSEESQELKDFLEICEDLINEDDMRLEESNNSSERGEKRKIGDLENNEPSDNLEINSSADKISKGGGVVSANYNAINVEHGISESDFDDEIFRSPPRTEFPSCTSVKVPKWA